MQGIVRKNYPMLDLAKFFCAFLVLFYHYFSEHPCLPSLIEEALSLYAVAVALFMAISGFLVFDKLALLESTAARWQCVKGQALRILKIYLLWSIPYLIYTVLGWERAEVTVRFLLRQLRQWVFGSTFYTIWFMPSLAIGLIVAFWVKEKLPRCVTYLLAALLYVSGSLLLTYEGVGARIVPVTGVVAKISPWVGGPRGWLFFGFPLTLLGGEMVRVKHKMRWRVTLVFSVLFMGCLLGEALVLRHFFGNTGVDMTLLMLPSVFFILGFLLSVNLPEGKYLLWMRKMSVLLFLSQRLFLTVLPDVLPAALMKVVFVNNYVGAIFICGGTVAFSAGIIFLSKKWKLLKHLY